MRRVYENVKVWGKRLRQVCHRPVVAAPIEAPWTASDAQHWKHILESPIGRKFISRARAIHYGMATNQQVAKKTAFGFAECINWALSLARVRAVEAENKSQTEPDLQADEAVAAYLERLKT